MNPQEKDGIAKALLALEGRLLGTSREIVRGLQVQSFESGVLLFELDPVLVRQVGPKLLQTLKATLSEHLGTSLQVRIHRKGSEVVQDRLYLDSSNRAVHLLLEGLGKDPKPPVEGMSPIVIHGPPGAGKTFFLRRFIEALEHPVAYWNAGDFIAQILRRAYKGGMTPFIRAIVESRILIIDEVHRLRKKHRCQQELARILDEMRSIGHLVLLASRHHPLKIHEFKESLASRFLGGFVARLGVPEKKTRMKILADQGLRGTQAEAFLAKMGKEPTMGRLFAELEEFKRQRAGNPLPREQALRPFQMGGWDLERLRDRVLEEFQVSLEEWGARHRPRRVSTARQVVAYLYRKGGVNSSETARHLGWFSSASVRNAVRRVEERMKEDEEFRRSVEGCMDV